MLGNHDPSNEVQSPCHSPSTDTEIQGADYARHFSGCVWRTWPHSLRFQVWTETRSRSLKIFITRNFLNADRSKAQNFNNITDFTLLGHRKFSSVRRYQLSLWWLCGLSSWPSSRPIPGSELFTASYSIGQLTNNRGSTFHSFRNNDGCQQRDNVWQLSRHPAAESVVRSTSTTVT